MNKSGKIFWLLLSILFAVGAIVAGTIYDNNRKKTLEVQTVTKTTATKEKETTKKKKQVTEEVATEESSYDEGEMTAEQSQAIANAQSLIGVIIIEGQVQSNFTLDDYRAAKSAVDALEYSSEKEELSAQITQIETALTNMGIIY